MVCASGAEVMYKLKNWDSRFKPWIQTDNGIEAILRKAGVVHWLEDCGPTAAVNLLNAQGYDTQVSCRGPWHPQPEDVLTLWLNDPRNAPIEREALPKVDPAKVLGNEFSNYYPAALSYVFGAKAFRLDGQEFVNVVDYIKNGIGVMFSLKTPRHFLAAGRCDDSRRVIGYRDSWPARTGTDGFDLDMTEAEFSANCNAVILAVYPPEG